MFSALTFTLPEWLISQMPEPETCFSTFEEKMRFVIRLSRLNIENGGGPFGAAVFNSETSRLLAPGVNLVLQTNCSICHAEMMAIMIAQKILGTYDLGGGGGSAYELVTSTEPCAMCFGAVPWSGIRKLICGARGEDAESIGFDEGPKRTDWKNALEARGIEVIPDILRNEAVSVLRKYAETGGIIYNVK